jgi:SagB-type dehydrogenase family enzyme
MPAPVPRPRHGRRPASESARKSVVIRILLAPRVHIVAVSKGTLRIETRGRCMSLVGLGGYEKALAKLQEGPLDWDDLPECWTDPEVVLAIRRLAERGLVQFDCAANSRVLLSATPVAGSRPAEFRELDPAEHYLLSRFAYLRRSGAALVLESGSTRWEVTIHEPALGALVAATACPVSVADAAQSQASLGPSAVSECLRFLVGVGAVTPLQGHAKPADERTPEFAQREFHDVLMHAQSRRGLAPQAIGGVFPFEGEFKPTKALKERTSDTVVTLDRPDLDTIVHKDMPLAEVMERRQSVRHFAERPLTASELGEFLYRVGRVRDLRKPEPNHGRGYETTSRTYPSGGAAYDLEIYVTARHCEGIAPGIYHYEPADHELSLVTQRASVIRQTIRDACQASGHHGVPQVVITLASRFNRLAWKYRGISYATTLKNVGVLYEAMYLAATAMGLAPCGLGSGDSALFSEATGLDPLVESSVGEFMLGVPQNMPLSEPPDARGHPALTTGQLAAAASPINTARTSPTAGSRPTGSGSGRCAWTR